MSEYSESFHLLGASQQDAMALLSRAGYSGVVFETTGAWTTFVPSADSYAALDAVVEHNEGVLLHYSYAADHGLFLTGYVAKQLAWRRTSSWDGPPEEPDVGNEAFMTSLAHAAQVHVDDIEALFDGEDSPSERFGHALGLTHFQWLSCEALNALGLDEVRDRGPFKVVGAPAPPISKPSKNWSARMESAGYREADGEDSYYEDAFQERFVPQRIVPQRFDGGDAASPMQPSQTLAHAVMVAAWRLWPKLATPPHRNTDADMTIELERIDALGRYCAAVEAAVRGPFEYAAPVQQPTLFDAGSITAAANAVCLFRLKPSEGPAAAAAVAPLVDATARAVVELARGAFDSREVLDAAITAEAATRFQLRSPDFQWLRFPNVVSTAGDGFYDARGVTMANGPEVDLPEALTALGATLALGRHFRSSDDLFAPQWQRIKSLLRELGTATTIDALGFWCRMYELFSANPEELLEVDGTSVSLGEVLESWGSFRGGVIDGFSRVLFGVFQHRIVLMVLRDVDSLERPTSHR